MSCSDEVRKSARVEAPALLIRIVTSLACSAMASAAFGSVTSSASGTASGCVTVFGSRGGVDLARASLVELLDQLLADAAAAAGD